jgi:hypothetical protein
MPFGSGNPACKHAPVPERASDSISMQDRAVQRELLILGSCSARSVLAQPYTVRCYQRGMSLEDGTGSHSEWKKQGEVAGTEEGIDGEDWLPRVR